VLPGLAAGALIGLAADLKITFILFGLGLAWAARRSPRTLLAATAGATAVLVPSYLWFGPPAIAVLVQRDLSATSDNWYQLFTGPFGLTSPPYLTVLAVTLFAALAVLLLWRLPEGFADRPAVRPALALSLAWLLVWPYQRPWYDAMAFCLLALYPASRLDWPLLARLAAVTIYSLPGMPGMPRSVWLAAITTVNEQLTVPATRFAALVAVVLLAMTGAWYARQKALADEPLPVRVA
jgi:hypothetical protein